MFSKWFRKFQMLLSASPVLRHRIWADVPDAPIRAPSLNEWTTENQRRSALRLTVRGKSAMWVWPNDRWTDSLGEMPIELTAYNPDKGIQEVGDMWLLRKGTTHLRCVLSTHPLGWELRAYAGHELARSQVCKSRRQVHDMTDAWRKEAATKGWT
jgi:hypothetical protein